jgi:hypothetical protein
VTRQNDTKRTIPMQWTEVIHKSIHLWGADGGQEVPSVSLTTFRGTYRLHLQSQKLAELEFYLAVRCTLVSCSATFHPWRWKWYVPPKRRITYALHGAISQKMATFRKRRVPIYGCILQAITSVHVLPTEFNVKVLYAITRWFSEATTWFPLYIMKVREGKSKYIISCHNWCIIVDAADSNGV